MVQFAKINFVALIALFASFLFIDLTHAAQTTSTYIAPATVKGIYLTANSASSPKKMTEVITLLDATELNAVVIDIKDYSGKVLYDSQLPLVLQFKTKRPVITDLPGLVNKLHARNIYVIARQAVFEDPALAERKSDWAIHRSGGGVWRNNAGQAWVDPTRREVWEYNAAIAKEVLVAGVDEINFDYIRFPSDGNLRSAVYAQLDGRKKYQVMADFYEFLDLELHPGGAVISADLFGLTMEAATSTDLGVGQRLVDAVNRFDYISPMMYPSHYAAGHLGFSNPAAHPGEVIAFGLKKAVPLFAESRARVRPWLQAFNLGAVYDGAKIRAQIAATERYNTSGWLLWNARNYYTAAGLKPDERLAKKVLPAALNFKAE